MQNKELHTEFSDWYIKDTPKTLNEVYGQKTIVDYMLKAQKSGSFDKNTIFMGDFGSGKTVLAKILAKSIACKRKNENGEPCNECPTCKAVDDMTFDRDVVYIDAESMSAQDIRNKVEEVTTFPAVRDAAKVIICDEAQSLSKEAVEAFLTATQTPKPGFFFIFTAMSKLQGSKAGALLTRCKQWKMKVPTPAETYTYLASICKKKGIMGQEGIPEEFFTEGLGFIAETSEASFRKAIQSLEQCYKAGAFTKEQIKDLLGVASFEDTSKVLVDIVNGNKNKIVWDFLMNGEYSEKFNLLLKIIGDAVAIKNFGTSFIEPSELWKYKYAIEISKGPLFDKLVDTFMELSKSAYLKKGEWEIAISNIMKAPTRLRETEQPVIMGRR